MLSSCVALTLGACGGDDNGGGGGGGGGGGNGGGANFLSCQEECAVDADCEVLGVNFTCDNARCVSDTTADIDMCVSDAQCQLSNNFVDFCEFDVDCGIGLVCVQTDAGNSNVCTFEALPAGGCLVGEEILARDVLGNPITVCGSPTSICNSGFCSVPCQTDADCSLGAFPDCNTQTGQCNCNDTSCQGSGFGDTCIESNLACSCTDASECTSPSPFPNTTKVCE